MGAIPVGFTEQYLASPVFEYNPRNLAPLDRSKMILDKMNRPRFPEGYFQPMPFRIDDSNYAIDMGSLDGDDLEADLDMDVEELLSE